MITGSSLGHHQAWCVGARFFSRAPTPKQNRFVFDAGLRESMTPGSFRAAPTPNSHQR
jgi:hypothetical protein